MQVNDNDVAGFILSPSTGAMQLNEGESSQGSLALATQPTANVVVSLSSSDGSEINVTETLTFTSSNWATPQTFDVNALTDSSVDGDQSVEIRIEVSASSDGIYSAIQPAILAVSVTDIDQAGLLISGADNLQVDEDGGFAEFQVTLSARPNRNVTVPLSLNPGGQASLSASSLTFTKNNWNTPQTVRVTGLDDFIDDDTVIFYVDVGPSSSSDNDFDDYTRQVLVSALDNDDAGIIRGNASSGALSENGGSVTYQISLASQPVQSVTIPVVSQDASLSVSPASLSLDATNWNTGATLTVTGQDDAIAQGERDITLVWGPAESDDAKYDGLTLLATALTVTDDDVAGIEVGSDNLGVGENGSSVVGKFRLTSEPRESVTLELSGGVGEVSFSSSTLTFNASNWANYQFVTLTGVDDDVDDGLQTETILIQASSLDLAYQGVSQSFTVQNADNDTAGINVGDVSSALVSEDGGISELSLTLSSRPLHDVTVSFALDSTRGTLSNATQVFTPAQWDESRTLRFNSVDDALDNGNVTVTISASTTSLDPLYDGISVAERTLTVIDDDASGLVFTSTTDFEVIEGDAQQASTNVKLATQPVDNVTLSFDVDVTEVAMISGDLTFTPLNWDQNQAIVFTSADDDIDDGTQATSVVVTSSSSDSDYNGLSQVLSCSTEDNDSAGVSVSITSSNVTEGGVSATASVVLDSEPVSTVTVSLGVDTSDLALNKTTLTFNSANWDSAQSFTVQANDDSVYEGAENGTLTVSTSASSDSLYSGLTTQTFDFSITDNESLPEISIADLSVSESDSSVLVSATVSVSPVSGDAITVGYSTQDDVALAGQDYQSAAGNVVIESGDSSATISLTVCWAII